MKETSEAHLAYYRNPAYWDGYELGQTGPSTIQTSFGSLIMEAPRHIRASAFGWYALESYIDSEEPHQAVTRLTEGQTFDPNNYKPLTVVAFCKESLSLHRKATLPLKTFAYENVGLPSRPLLKPLTQLAQTAEQYYRSASCTYAISPKWGAVIKERRDNVLYSLSSILAWQKGGDKGQVVLFPFFSLEPDSIPVGKVIGSPCRDAGKPSPKYFERYTYVDIFDPQPRAQGKPVTEKPRRHVVRTRQPRAAII
jgi:hypothetical protein